MEKINIAEILKNCPQGMELDCVIWNNVTLGGIDSGSSYPIEIRIIKGDKTTVEYLTKFGEWDTNENSKCVIFPKGKTTWEGFQKPFKDGDIIATDLGSVFILKSCLEDKIHYHSYIGLTCCDEIQEKQIPFAYKHVCHLANEEEKVDNQNCVKSVDKAEPRFQEGDFIVDPYCRGKIIALTSDAYLLDTGQGIPFSCEDNVHLWTIEDAKDGDVLKEDSCTFIIERMKPNKTAIIHCCLFDDGDFDLGSTLSFDVDSIYPATKEQRDLLFQKIKEAGYEWDAEKKELKKIDDEEVNGEDYGIDGFWHAKRILEKTLGSVSGYQTDDGILDHKAAITAVKKLYEQKTTWSEEDEKKLSDILAILRGGENCYYNSPILMDWLKSLKEKIGG